MTVRGLVRLSDTLDEPNIDSIHLSNGGRVKVQARLRDLDDTRFDEFCGRVVTVVGTYTVRDGQTGIRELTSVRP
jgi:hypothetical protein